MVLTVFFRLASVFTLVFHALTLLIVCSGASLANETLQISVVDSDTPTEAILAKPGTYIGEKFTFEQLHSGEVKVLVGVWESGVGESVLKAFPFTEYVLMISGRVVVTEQNGSSKEFSAGDTFVIPKGWSGVWDVKERMKKQIVRIGSADVQQ